jgi:hypothetical protein
MEGRKREDTKAAECIHKPVLCLTFSVHLYKHEKQGIISKMINFFNREASYWNKEGKKRKRTGRKRRRRLKRKGERGVMNDNRFCCWA